MDHNIGQLVSVLDELGVAENTLIIFVSDNGGCTMEEGAAGGRFPGNNGPLRGGKATTYQGGLNVPFVMNWKGKLPQSGLVSDSHVMHCDIFSTLLDAAGLTVPESNGENPVRGTSLVPHILSGGKTSVPERTMIFELWGNIGVRRGGYKLWASVGRDYSPDWDALAAEISQKDLELFDLQRDVAETNDLRTKYPELYASLKAELLDHLLGINADYPLVPMSDVKGDRDSVTPRQQKQSKTISPKRRSPEKFFQARDRNSDGEITLDEFIGKPDGRNVSALTKRFQQFDANGDGVLVVGELKSN
jgi:arylsulfatase A-like enzyme